MATFIFDFDGTIADSFSVACNILVDQAAYLGCKQLTPRELPELKSLHAREVLKYLNVSFWRISSFVRKLKKITNSHLDDIAIFPEWIKTLQQLGLHHQIGLISSNAFSTVEFILKKHQLLGLFDFIDCDKSLFGKKRVLNRLIKQKSLNALTLKPGATILDVGCGSGKPIAAYLVEKGFDVYGLDISPKLIEYAKNIIPDRQLFLADICEFTTDIHFDVIICWFTLFHIHAIHHFDILKKLHSFLESDGILLITFADTSCEPGGTNVKVIDEHMIESEMFGERFCHSGNPANINSELIKQAGFEIISDKIDQPGNQVILARKK